MVISVVLCSSCHEVEEHVDRPIHFDLLSEVLYENNNEIPRPMTCSNLVSYDAMDLKYESHTNIFEI